MLVNVQRNLYALEDFLNKNPHLFHSSPGDIASVRTAPGNEQEAWKVHFFCKRVLQCSLIDKYPRRNKVQFNNFKHC
jgi:hypothetical protein